MPKIRLRATPQFLVVAKTVSIAPPRTQGLTNNSCGPCGITGKCCLPTSSGGDLILPDFVDDICVFDDLSKMAGSLVIGTIVSLHSGTDPHLWRGPHPAEGCDLKRELANINPFAFARTSQTQLCR